MKVFITACVCLYLAGGIRAQAPGDAASTRTNPLAGQQQALEDGRKRFSETCAVCHGLHGEGGQGGEGQGPNLVTSGVVRRASDGELFGIVRNGVPKSAMPAFTLADEQIWQLVTYLRSLSLTAMWLRVPGDVENGRAIFFGKAECGSCHMIRGRGGFLGPDLTDVGATRRVDQLRDAILKTTNGASTSGDLYGDPLAGFRPLIITTEDGRRIEAIAKHWSNYSIQALDRTGKIHILRGDAVKRATFREKSWMPDDYGSRLSDDELQDLLAFLGRQSVRSPAASKTPE